jgi:hypothetical protein
VSDYKVETVRDLHSRGFEYLRVVHVAEVEAKEDKIDRLQTLADELKARVAELEASAVVPSGVWQFYFDGEWTTGMNTNDHRANTKAAGFLIRDLWLKQEPTQ